MIAERYGVQRLAVGDDMTIPSKGMLTGVQMAIYGYARNRGWKVKTRHVPKGLRIWRTA